MVWRFPVWYLFLSGSMCISPFGPSLSPSSSLVILSIHSAFSLCFLVTIFLSRNVQFLWRPVVGMFLCHALPIVDRIFFRCFGMSCCVCIVLPFVDISSCIVIFLVLFSPFSSHIFQDLFVLPFWPVFVDFLSAFPVEFPSCFFVLLRGSEFSHTTILPLHRLVRLTLLYYSLIC